MVKGPPQIGDAQHAAGVNQSAVRPHHEAYSTRGYMTVNAVSGERDSSPK